VSNLKTGISKKLTNGEWTVRDAGWINDSEIIVIKTISPYSGDYTNSGAVVLDVNSGNMKDVAKELTTLGDAEFSSTTNMLAVRHTKNNIPANIPEISLIRWKDKKTVNSTAKLDRSVSAYKWMPAGNSLILQLADGLKSRLTIMSLDGKTNEIPLNDVTGIGQLAVNTDGQIALTGTTPTKGAEIYLYEPATKNLEKLTSYNQFLEGFTLGKTEGIEWQVGGGMIADGAVTYPPNFEKGKKYPLVLYIHGGPTAASGISLSPFVQHLAAQGWIVFQPNYRGSTNRGNNFQNAISNDAGFGPGEDIIKGIDALKQKGFIDEKKIAVTGWSYGGYMTAWLIGRYPTMWKSAVAGAAPVDITDMSSLTDLNAAIRHAITSSPWKGDNYKKYYEMSPISNLSKARAPTLIMSVVGDERVSITGSYKIYHALKANDVPVQFIAYPGTAHFPSDPVNNNDVYLRWTAWLKKYLD
jgi:dipeptidyl aminopeptidase/acylaminoacyl peptidase